MEDLGFSAHDGSIAAMRALEAFLTSDPRRVVLPPYAEATIDGREVICVDRRTFTELVCGLLSVTVEAMRESAEHRGAEGDEEIDAEVLRVVRNSIEEHTIEALSKDAASG
jgi:hypothetical protein